MDNNFKDLTFSSEKLDLYPVGILPPLYHVPEKMYAWTIRSDRLGDINSAYKEELVCVPKIKENEVLVANVSAGVNYNGIWAAKGEPKDVVASNGNYGDEHCDFHICGSESSGIVYAVGDAVRSVKPGDAVILSGSRYDPECPLIKQDPEETWLSPSAHIWGYESNWGAFAQFSKVYDYQCLKKPDFMNWDEAAGCTATGVTVYRMLFHWQGNQLKKGDVVLVWGAAGGLGSYAIKIAKAIGAIPVAVVSDDEKGKYCMSIGAAGFIDRKKYSHWGSIDGLNEKEQKRWNFSATKFRNEIYEIVGERKSPAIVFEHPGSDTLATSLLVCDTGGMVVLCGATSGYTASIDLRHLWIHQKRIQGSHGGTANDAKKFLELCREHNIKPMIHRCYDWNDLPQAHMDLEKGNGICGKLIVHIGNGGVK